LQFNYPYDSLKGLLQEKPSALKREHPALFRDSTEFQSGSGSATLEKSQLAWHKENQKKTETGPNRCRHVYTMAE
jgi:hypothetical protein